MCYSRARGAEKVARSRFGQVNRIPQYGRFGSYDTQVAALDRTVAVRITTPLGDVATLASLAGTSRVTVNRVLGELEQAGAVLVARGRITVVDRDRVARAAR